MPRLFSSLRARLVILVLIAALPAFALIVWTGIAQRNHERDRAREDAQRLAQVVATQQSEIVEGTRQMFLALAAAPQVVGGDPAACRGYLAAVNAVEKQYIAITLASPAGDIVCSSVTLNGPANISDREYVQRALRTRQFTTGEYVIARGGLNVPTLPFAYPLYSQAGEITGMLVSGVDLTWFSTLVGQAPLPKGAAVTVIDRNGVVLSRYPDPEIWQGQDVSQTPLGQVVLERGTGTSETEGVDSVRRLYSFRPLGASDSGAYVAVGISTAGAYRYADSALYRNLSLLAGVTLLPLLAAWFGGDWFVLRGVRALTRSAHRVAGGDLTARSGLQSDRGEIGQLARGFDEMAAALERREADRKASDDALREIEGRFRSFVEHAAAGILMVDEQGVIVSLNPAAEAMFGYPGAELIGQPVEVLLPEDARSRNPDRRRAFWQAPSARSLGTGFDLHACRKDGSEFPVAIGLTPLSAGAHRLVAATVSDVSDQKRTEDRLEQTMQNLARSNAELEQFAYVASHDLQEPLRMVGNYTQLLQRRYAGKLDADADDFINYAVDGAKRMHTLINDLLNFSRVSSRGKDRVPVDAEAVLARTLQDLSAVIRESQAEITHDPLPAVLADDGQIGQLLQNLIANGIKFRGDAPPRVHVSAEPEGAGYRFSVKDNGIGIAPDYFDRIFVIFQRLQGRAAYPGNGIGLAVCKKIVERHGGRIWVESPPGEGATFHFTLPAAVPERAAA